MPLKELLDDLDPVYFGELERSLIGEHDWGNYSNDDGCCSRMRFWFVNNSVLSLKFHGGVTMKYVESVVSRCLENDQLFSRKRSIPVPDHRCYVGGSKTIFDLGLQPFADFDIKPLEGEQPPVLSEKAKDLCREP